MKIITEQERERLRAMGKRGGATRAKQFTRKYQKAARAKVSHASCVANGRKGALIAAQNRARQTFTFTNCKPSAHDSLGEITWRAVQACEKCGNLNRADVLTQARWYDGCRWEEPHCGKCGKIIRGLPDDPNERVLMIARYPELELANLARAIDAAQKNANTATA
jgi:hypothetical protein